jgi:hypothetical protein
VVEAAEEKMKEWKIAVEDSFRGKCSWVDCENDGVSSVSADVLNTSSVATVLPSDERVQTLLSAVGDTLLKVHSVVATLPLQLYFTSSLELLQHEVTG